MDMEPQRTRLMAWDDYSKLSLEWNRGWFWPIDEVRAYAAGNCP